MQEVAHVNADRATKHDEHAMPPCNKGNFSMHTGEAQKVAYDGIHQAS